MQGRSPTCYSPVRHSCTPKGLTVRLACVRPPASVHPEPGSNSPLYVCLTHSKVIDALVFPYFFGCYLYVNDLYSYRFFFGKSFCRSVPNCDCKSIKLFLIDQMFFKKIKSFLSNPYLSIILIQSISTSLPASLDLGLQR